MKSSISSLGSSFSGDSQLMITQIHIIKDKDTFGLQNKADSFLRNSLDNQDGGKKQMLTEMGSKIHTPIKDNFLSRRIRAMKA